MTITAEIRDELIRLDHQQPGCRRAQLATMLRLGSELRVNRGLALVAAVDRGTVARYLRREITELYGMPATAMVRGRNCYEVRVTERAAELAQAAGMVDSRLIETAGLPIAVVGGSPNELAAALRGAFLVSGTLSGVGRNSALEIRCPSPESAYALASCAKRIGVNALVREIRGFDAMVVRDPDNIVLLLTRMGATDSVEEWRRVGVRQRLKMWGNIDAANARRTAVAAVSTCAKVEAALRILGDAAPANLAYAGQLRLKYREASLEELGRYANPPLSKDTVAGQLRRLQTLAEKHANQQMESAVSAA